MKFIKRVNQISGLLMFLCFVAMVMIACIHRDMTAYYITGGVFLLCAAIFLATGLIFICRSLVWHIRHRKVGMMIRHYIYAYVGFYVLLMVLDHITMKSISWIHNLLYPLIAAVIQVYLDGMRLEPVPETVHLPEDDPAQDA